MLGNIPILRYDRHHHWMWVLRRIVPPSRVFVSIALIVFIGIIIINTIFEFLSLIGLFTLSILIIQTGWLGYVYLDWRTRNIRLYSDGRLDYEFGILYRDGKSVSMRFGAVRYRYHNRIGTLLDCADLVLPFDAGILEDIGYFREFWNIAQGRE